MTGADVKRKRSDDKQDGAANSDSSDGACLSRRFAKKGRSSRSAGSASAAGGAGAGADAAGVSETKKTANTFHTKTPNIQDTVYVSADDRNTKETLNQTVEHWFDLPGGTLEETFGPAMLDNNDDEHPDQDVWMDDDNAGDSSDSSSHAGEGPESPDGAGEGEGGEEAQEGDGKDCGKELESVELVDELLSVDAMLVQYGLEMVTLECHDKVIHTIGKGGDTVGSITLMPRKNGRRSVKAACSLKHNVSGQSSCSCWCTLRGDFNFMPVHCAMVRWFGRATAGSAGRDAHLAEAKAINFKYSSRHCQSDIDWTIPSQSSPALVLDWRLLDSCFDCLILRSRVDSLHAVSNVNC